ncbi:MAG: hypothetical protein GC200_10325 [Tepidisphaera sp.]|nr:hypothetical protein [Tepidisphaera sp.]
MDFSFSFKKKPEGMGGSQPKKENPAETQFNLIRGCGLNLSGHTQLKDIVAGVDESLFESSPFAGVLALMGSPTEEGEPRSDDVWLYQAAEETSPDELAAIAFNLARLTKGTLALDEIGAGVDEERGVVIVSFTLDGEQSGFELDPNEGELVASTFAIVGGMMEERGDGAKLAFTDAEGLGRIFVFLQPQELGELAETTQLEWGYVIEAAE